MYIKSLNDLYNTYKSGNKGCVLEGGARSRKTVSGVDFLIYLCSNNENNVINIVRETYKSFKTTLYDDFNTRFPEFGLLSPCQSVKEVQTFNLFNNKINFLGADSPDKFQGAGCDYFFINEAMDVNKSVFEQLEIRCRKFWWMDYNPKYTQHWIFDTLEKRPDVKFHKSTFLDNPYCSKAERDKILSYEPTPENIMRGTADDINWSIYGLGNRTSVQGLIFKYVSWIDKFPEDVTNYCYGLDFGFTNDPTALVKIGIKGKDLFLELLVYEPVDNVITLDHILNALKIRKDKKITCDSADKYNDYEMAKDLKNLNWDIEKVNKGKGLNYSIGKMKEYKINIVANNHFKKEQENYRWRLVNGITINEPIDKFNHAWDASRYGLLGFLKDDFGY